MLRLYNCTRIYIVKYRQSIAFCYIYIYWWPFFCGSGGRMPQADLRKSHKPPFVVVLTPSCVRWMSTSGCLHYCLRQGTGATLTLRNARYRLERVWFGTSRLSIYAALPRTVDRNNATHVGHVRSKPDCLFWD